MTMKIYKNGDKVIWNEKEYTVVTRRKNFSNNKISYILEGVSGEIPEEQITDEEEKKRVKFAKGLLKNEETRLRALRVKRAEALTPYLSVIEGLGSDFNNVDLAEYTEDEFAELLNKLELKLNEQPPVEDIEEEDLDFDNDEEETEESEDGSEEEEEKSSKKLKRTKK